MKEDLGLSECLEKPLFTASEPRARFESSQSVARIFNNLTPSLEFVKPLHVLRYCHVALLEIEKLLK